MIKVCSRYGLYELPFIPGGRVMALGMFDGLHQGHLDIIKSAVPVNRLLRFLLN